VVLALRTDGDNVVDSMFEGVMERPKAVVLDQAMLQDPSGPVVREPSDANAVIRVEDVHRYYDLGETRVHALRGVSLAVERGGFVAIMGSSGSGKSTLMNMLGCLDRPSSGRYLLEGTDVSKLEKAELAVIRNRKIGFVFQGFNLLARTTALENTALPTLYTPIDKEERARRAAEALAMVGLANRADHYPSQMSGGQQQRVAIARALVNRPAILFADEPTGNLDSRTAVEIMDIFQTLNDGGLTVVMVTHEPDVAQFAKRVIVFRDGKIRKDECVSARPRASDVLKTLPTLDD
jgi:putative ABC transport system ATP-binding protein